MPDRDVRTVRDQIFFQYAKIIACSAMGFANGSSWRWIRAASIAEERPI